MGQEEAAGLGLFSTPLENLKRNEAMCEGMNKSEAIQTLTIQQNSLVSALQTSLAVIKKLEAANTSLEEARLDSEHWQEIYDSLTKQARKPFEALHKDNQRKRVRDLEAEVDRLKNQFMLDEDILILNVQKMYGGGVLDAEATADVDELNSLGEEEKHLENWTRDIENVDGYMLDKLVKIMDSKSASQKLMQQIMSALKTGSGDTMHTYHRFAFVTCTAIFCF